MAKPKEQSQEKQSQQPARRIFKGKEEIMHDLFVLKLASFKKNVSWTEDPLYEEVPHLHMFHSVDSSGAVQTRCTPVGGHFHEITLVKSEDGAPPRAVCSTPKKIIRNRRGQRIVVDFDPKDQHIHDVEYRRSEVLRPRILNPEAAKHQAMEAQKESPLPDVQG